MAVCAFRIAVDGDSGGNTLLTATPHPEGDGCNGGQSCEHCEPEHGCSRKPTRAGVGVMDDKLRRRANRSRQACQVLQQPNAAYDEIQRLQSELTAARNEAETLRGRVGDLESALRVARGDLKHAIENEACEFSGDPLLDIDKALEHPDGRP